MRNVLTKQSIVEFMHDGQANDACEHSRGVGFSLIAGNPDRIVEVQDVEERTGHKCLEEGHGLNADAWQCADTEPVASDGAHCDDPCGQPHLRLSTFSAEHPQHHSHRKSVQQYTHFQGSCVYGV